MGSYEVAFSKTTNIEPHAKESSCSRPETVALSKGLLARLAPPWLLGTWLSEGVQATVNWKEGSLCAGCLYKLPGLC